MRKFLTILFCVTTMSLYAQREASIWYFGQGAGLSFAQTPPQALTDGRLYSDEGCGTISDSQGRLLFYCNGTSVTNRNHQGMLNGSGLSGDQSSTQGVLIVPQPGNDSLYYIFTNGAVHMLLENGLKYSVVNIRGDNGLGEVIRKNVGLLTETYERIAAVRHCNNQDIWIVVRKWESDQYYAFLLTASGISSTPVISSTGNIIDGDINNNIGGIKFSSKGTKLACAFGYSKDRIELLDFNNQTGRFSNAVMFKPNVSNTTAGFPGAYGLEFSPNNDYLYINTFNDVLDSRLYQFNVTVNNPVMIEASRQLIHTETSGSGAGSIQVGPDRKLYVAYRGKSAVSVINQPDNPGTACQFVQDAIVLDPTGQRKSSAGFPNNLQSYFDQASNSYDFYRGGVCTDRTVSFNMNYTTGFDSVRWDFGDGGSSALIAPVHTFASPGFHEVRLTIFKQTCSANSQLVSKRIWIAAGSDFLEAEKRFCMPGSAVLAPSQVEGSLTWSNGSHGTSLDVNQPGTYWLEIENSGCRMRDSTVVYVIPPPVISLGADSPVCSLKPVRYDAGAGMTAYEWNTGDTTRFLVINKPGEYKVTVTTAEGCTAKDSVNVYPGDCGLYLPTAFTPNGDGLNELFGPIDMLYAATYQLTVYNRYGQEVFRSNDPARKWDGKKNGKPLPAGTYIYILLMQQPGRPAVNNHGTVVLFR